LNIVHRDVTPENIFVSFDGTVKILDFGIAKAANRTDQTRAGEIKGKLSYMSPEQCMGRPLDRRSDLFSLGVVLYEWLTGFKLFTGDSEVAILRSITEGKIYAPSYFKSDIPEAVERILMRALEKDREQRYQTAWEMQYDLDQFLGQYEFTPSNIHLSNFLKQLFSDELDAERDRLNSAVLSQGDISAVDALPPPLPADALADNVADEMLEDLELSGSLTKDADDESTVAAPPPALMGPMVPLVPPLAAVPSTSGVEAAAPSRVSLQLELRESELLSLEQLALKHGLTPQALAREVLSAWLKYR
jgi:serine/threonine-protein kinase